MTPLRWQSGADALAAGASLAAELAPGAVIALVGDLGAGKTHFTKGIARGLGHEGEVTSPTFTLVHEYRGGTLPVFHFDLYRLESATEALAVGWEEYLDEPGVCVVEWADKFPALLPPGARWFRIGRESDGTRVISEVPGP